MRLAARQARIALPELTLPHLWALTALMTVYLPCALGSIFLGDFWWHLRIGEIIATSGRIPGADVFSFVANGRDYVYHEWLGEVFLYTLFRLGGLELVFLANTLMLTATAALVLLAAYETSQNLRVAAIATIAGVYIALSNRDVRPQTLGFLFFALFYLLLTRYRRGKSAPLWLLPPLAALWANVHGSAILGWGLCLLVFAGEALQMLLGGRWGSKEERRRLLGLGAVAAAVPVGMMLNPWGIRFFEYLQVIQGNSIIQSWVTEWFPPMLRNPQNVPFFLALLGCAALFGLSPKPLNLTEIAVFLVFTVFALAAVRNSVWFGIAVTPLAAQEIAAVLGRRADAGIAGAPRRGARTPRSLVAGNYLLASMLVGLAVLTLPWVKQSLSLPAYWRGLIDGKTPVAAVQFTGERFPRERFFHPLTYGSYMIWAAPSRPPVFVDGRVELYPDDVWEDYIQISLAQGWQERLAKYGIRHVMLSKHPEESFQQPLLATLRGAPDWAAVYEDETTVIFAQRD